MKPIRLTILGATGSIGQSARRVLLEHRERIQVDGLVAHSRVQDLTTMADELGASWVGVTDRRQADELTRHTAGRDVVVGIDEVVSRLESAESTHVLAAMSGFAGLRPVLAALSRGMTVLLANKETLVAAGDLVRQVRDQYGGQVIPVDSEHSAIFQCLGMEQPPRRLIVTCSGGPFRGRSRQDLAGVTVAEALAHPNWSMGAKITVDSATLMNKGLEVIEAHHLFDMPYDKIDVVVHPQSVIHSLVEFVDGATLAQLGWPDMRVPILVALTWPDRWPLEIPPLNLVGQSLTFEEPDHEVFPLLGLARDAGVRGGAWPAVLNAANEVAVEAFLQDKIPFLTIAHVVQDVLEHYRSPAEMRSLGEVLETDRAARELARDILKQAERR